MASSEFVDWYDVLELDSNSTLEEIKRRYRKIALETHPDKNGHLSDAERARKAERFKLAGRAYEVLSDPEARSAFDVERQARAGEAAGSHTSAASTLDTDEAVAIFIRFVGAVCREQMEADGGGAWMALIRWIPAAVVGGVTFAASRDARIGGLGLQMAFLVVHSEGVKKTLSKLTDEERDDVRKAFLLVCEQLGR